MDDEVLLRNGVSRQSVSEQNTAVNEASENASPPPPRYVVGIGGRDVRVETVTDIVEDVINREEPDMSLFVGVKGLPIGPLRADTTIRPPAPLEVAR